jgi:hypothetical protein
MTLVQQAPRLFTSADDFVRAMLVYGDEHQTEPSVTWEALYPTVKLSQTALVTLARLGAINLASTYAHHNRTGTARTNGRNARQNGPAGIAQKDLAPLVMQQLRFGGKRLSDFTQEDWEAYVETSKNQYQGWGRKHKVAKAVVEALTAHKAETVMDLPEGVRADLDTRVASAWM